MPPRSWTEVRCTVPPDRQDDLVARLAPLGFAGFLQEDDLLIGYIERRRWTPKLRRQVRTLLQDSLKKRGITHDKLISSTLHDRNWNAAWERSAGIVEATDRIIIKPSWKKLRKRDRGKIIVQIDPKMSFGTGHHETTRLCLEMLQRYLNAGDRLLDIGTGTGILAIAGVKLGAHSAVGIDHDSWSVQNARENVRRNRVQGRVTIRRGDLSSLPSRAFDILIANIDFPTFRASLKKIARRVKPGRLLIVSGILVSDLEHFIGLVTSPRLIPIEIAVEGEWAAIVLHRDHAHRRS